MRGQGIQTNHRFKWAKQENGRYTIFSVPIFETAHIKRKNVDENFNQTWLDKAIRTFQKERNKGKYPRIHIGHHQEEGTENRPGAGYLDFLERKGEMLYADLVEIPAHIFQDIQEGKYPARSVEILDPFDKVTSLALLESRSPYFDFPILMLEDQPTPLLFQSRRAIIRMQEEEKEEKKEDIEASCKAKKIMAQEEEEAPPDSPGEEPEAPPMEPETPMPGEQMPDWAREIQTGQQRIFDFLQRLTDALGLEEETQMPAQQPEPVAMQENESIVQMQKQLDGMNAEIKVRTRFNELKEQLGDSSEVLQRALEFSKESEKAALMYLDDVSKLAPKQESEHPASQKAYEQYVQGEGIEQDEFSEVRRVAFQAYQETLEKGSERDKKWIKNIAKTPKAFVERAVNMERWKPGSFTSMAIFQK